MNKGIKDIFYKCIIPEAVLGKVDVYFNYSVAFSTRLTEYNKICKCKIEDSDTLIPTLIINNKEEFDRLLIEYVRKASAFYGDENFLKEILNYALYDNKKMICKEKAILMHLMANATYEDFNDPISFLRKRIAFIDNYYYERNKLGYSDILDCNLELEVTKDTINNETPSQLVVKATNGQNSYTFPGIKFGISDDTVYIYAIQNKEEDVNPLSKKINRKLYKVGEGFIDQEIDENPKDVTASFLVALNMAINYFRGKGYTKFVVPSILIVRANAKKIIINRKKMTDEERIDKKKKEDIIQANLTNKLIRTFLRLGCHYNNIDIISFPYEMDSALHVEINNEEEICNNRLLDETGNMAREMYTDSKKK